MVIEIKSYVPEPLNIFHEIFTIPLLYALQGCKCHSFLPMKVFTAKKNHHVILGRDGPRL